MVGSAIVKSKLKFTAGHFTARHGEIDLMQERVIVARSVKSARASVRGALARWNPNHRREIS